MSALAYTPPPTVAKFMDDNSIVRCLVGPLGSGKSMGCIMEIVRRCYLQAPYNNVRYSRWALVRNTAQQLRLSVLADIQQYLGPIVSFRVTDSILQIRAGLPDGTSIHADLILIPLDTKEDVRRLLSTQLSGAWVNEVREVPIEIIDGILGRLGRYPSRAMGGPSWYGLIADTNPWDTDSAYHEAFVLEPVAGWSLFHQPSGVGPGAENTENLPDGYYENLMARNNDDWASVHVESEWGTSNAGQAVFRKSFDAPTHVRDMKPVVNPARPIIVGLDFGRTPCAVIGQVDNYGRLIIMKEVITEGMGLIQMVREHLKPVLLDTPFAGRQVFIVGDPAGMQKSQVTEQTPFDVLKEEGFLAYPASTNKVEHRLLAVEKLLKTQISGEPGIQINRTGCPILVRSLGSMYRFKKRRDGQLEDLPEKLHPWSDVVDATQYLALGVQMNLTARVLARASSRFARSGQKMSAAGWT